MNCYKVHCMWQSCVPIVLIILLVPVFLFAQADFFVHSTLPADGDVSVDPYGTLQITFSESIDTTVLFEYPPYFYINLTLEPDTLMGEPDSITFDPTFTTIYFHNLKLYPDTKYLLLVNNAVSLDGDSLEIPYVATFTTGESLPTAKMTGTVDLPGENPRGAIVSLLNSSLFSDENGSTESATVVVEATGEYLVQYIPPGTYWPVAFLDFNIDNNGDFSPRENSVFGFYDSNGDMTPDSIEVTEGDSISAIDISLTRITSGTARQNYEAVKDEALVWAADAVLIGITGPYIDEHGATYIWGYTFYSAALDEARDWMALGPVIIPGDTFSIPPSNTIALPENWIDSDMASDSAEFYGGQQFREENENVVVMAFLGYSLSIDDDDDDDGDKKFNLNKILKKNTTYSLNSKKMAPFSFREIEREFRVKQRPSPRNLSTVRDGSFLDFSKPAETNNDPYWYFIYVGEEEDAFQFIFVNAITGEVAGAVTARVAEQASMQEALQWAADIELVGVIAWHEDGILEDGTSSSWAVQYYSPAFDSTITVVTFNGIVMGAFSMHGLPAPEVIPIPPNWIDSDSVMTVAEANGGLDYRNANEGIVVYAFLSSGFVPWEIDKVAWVIFYNSHTAETLTIYVDCFSGQIITKVEDIHESRLLPTVFELKQNYPNPFNPTTTIEFDLPKPGFVTLKVYNALGEEVLASINENLHTGRYKTVLDATSLPSGLYFYRIQSGSFVKTRKMLLIK